MKDFEPWIAKVGTDAGGTEPRVRWKGGYAVTALRDLGKEHDLPGREALLSEEDISEHRDVLILGERSGGVRDFLHWWRSALDNTQQPWIQVHEGEWEPNLVQVSAHHFGEGAGSSGEPLNLLLSLGRDYSAAEKAEALLKWIKALSVEKVSLLIRVTGTELPESTSNALRIIRDGNGHSKLHVLVGTESEATFTANAFWSGYLDVARCYRLRAFGDAEVRALLAWHGKRTNRSLEGSQQVLEEVLSCVGGQPLLTQDMVRRLVERCAGREIGTNDVQAVFHKLSLSPPESARFWQAELKKILILHPELVLAMRSYVQGHTLGPVRFPPPAHERPLLVSGWVRLNHLGRWGITSKLHASLARPVLDQLQRSSTQVKDGESQ
jgi:hypothetical protein